METNARPHHIACYESLPERVGKIGDDSLKYRLFSVNDRGTFGNRPHAERNASKGCNE
jgi:hypothetical protein